MEISNKKILINACMIARQPSGVGVYSIELLRNLVKLLESRNYKFTIYCYEPDVLSEINIVSVKITLGTVFDKLLKNYQAIHRHIWNLFVLSYVGYSYNMLFAFSSHGTLFHRNQIITIHDLICLNFPNAHRGQYYYFKFIVPKLISMSRHIVTISNFTKNEVNSFYKLPIDKISVIYNGIDHLEQISSDRSTWLSDITNDMPFCLIVGASYAHKNLDTVIEIGRRMRAQNVKFIIVNKPNLYSRSLENQVKNENLNNFIFLEFISKADLAFLYKTARLNLYLSLYEGFGFPPAEASLYKTQSLLISKSALPEIYGNECEFCGVDEINEMVAIVTRYVLSPCKIEINSYSLLKSKYNWNEAGNRTMHLIDSMLYFVLIMLNIMLI